MPSKNRAGKLLVAVLLGATGCNSGTEIPLANVEPVTITPQKPNKNLPKGLIMSPPNITGGGGAR